MVKIIVIFFLRYWGYLKPLLSKFKGNVARVKRPLALFDRLRQIMQISKPVKFSRRPGTFEVFHYSSDERIIEIITEIKFAIKILLIHSWEELLTCFDCKVCFGSKFTSSAEGRRFNWLIYDSMTSLFACGRFSKSRGLSASVSFLPSFPFPFPLFYSLHSSPCNSLLPNCTETLATQANKNDTISSHVKISMISLLSSFSLSNCTAQNSFQHSPRRRF